MNGHAISFPSKQDVVCPGDRPAWVGSFKEFHLIANVDCAFGEHTKVPAGAACLSDALRHCLDAPASRNFPAWLSRLADLDSAIVDSISITNADGLFLALGNR